jgi:inorganic triphosphatase YgiF
MLSEIELKLSLSSAEARRLAVQPALAAVRPQRYRLFNTYYDTPDLALYRRRIALRLRRKGRSEWLMTVKGSDPVAGALARRSEWEAPTQPGVFDFDIVTDAGLCAFLKSSQADLRPVFSTDFTRMAWLIERSGALVEVALDRGKIEAVSLEDDEKNVPARANEAICELELELVEGQSTDALFELAIELAAEVHLHPAIASKAERGYALAATAGISPTKSAPSPVKKDMSPVEAFRAIALDCLLQLQRNEQGVVSGRDVEYVHQARIAIRRLRSCSRFFAPALAPAFVKVYAPRWGALGRQLGGARNWDVFLTETLSPLEKAFPGDEVLARLREHSQVVQSEARASAAVALSGQGYSHLLLAFAAALYRFEPPTIESGDVDKCVGKSELRKFAKRRLRKCLAAILRSVKKPKRLDDAAWHRLRIACKKLRYALEFFAPLLPRRRLNHYQEGLVAFQELLGKFNDQVTAERLIGELYPDGSASLISAWIAGRKYLLPHALIEALAGFLALKKTW